MMGADYYETPEQQLDNASKGIFNIGVGRNCEISHTIIDKNARIGNNVKLSPTGKPDGDYPHGIIIRDGVLVVPKGVIVPSGTVV
jgi:glucose-1-phosphate adenylyltransferase